MAVVGCGPVGGAVAQKLALRDRIREIRLIDPHAGIAQGKALDILQAAPVERFSTRISTSQTFHGAAGADAIVVADAGETGAEHSGEAGLALIKQIAAVDAAAPLVFAGASQRELIGRVISELRVPRSRVLGTAPAALESALRSLAGLAIDVSGVDVQLKIVGTPPNRIVVGWEEATACGLPLGSQLAPHVMASLSARIPKLWPPGPFALSSAAARVIEAVVNGSRTRYSCFVGLDSGPTRGAVAVMPIEAGPRGVVQVLVPALTRQEQTLMENAIERG